MKILLCLIALSLNLNAHIIGEIFEDTVYGKEAEGVKIVGGRSKQAPERRVYQVTVSSKEGSGTDIVVVSQETGRIVAITTSVESIEEGVLKATYFCEGEVFLPTKAVWARGLILENTPGLKYRGKIFDITLDRIGDRNGYTLRVECPSLLQIVASEAMKERSKQLKQQRDAYFKKQQSQSAEETVKK